MEIGIMSGRLTKQIDNQIQAFPVLTWKEEFKLAKKIGFSFIEWVLDSSPNPILTEIGRNQMDSLSKENNIKIKSICCDYFMKNKLFGIDTNSNKKNKNFLINLISICSMMNIRKIEIPLVDSSSIKNENDKLQFIDILNEVISYLPNNVHIILETDFSPSIFSNFLSNFDKNKIRANYDTGNSASLGFDMEKEFSEYGERISNIHIKDRLLGGETVSLGNGDVDFVKFFSLIKKIKYDDDLVIQGARQDSIMKPEATCKEYLKFIKKYLDKDIK